MYDVYGDGWNGNQARISGCNLADLAAGVGADVFEEGLTLDSGSSGAVSVCLPSSYGYTVEVGGGLWPSEVSWKLLDSEGNTHVAAAGSASGAPHAGPGEDALTSSTCCTESHWSFRMYDSYGDGWHGGYWTLINPSVTG